MNHLFGAGNTLCTAGGVDNGSCACGLPANLGLITYQIGSPRHIQSGLRFDF